jgi:hypothetical protein
MEAFRDKNRFRQLGHYGAVNTGDDVSNVDYGAIAYSLGPMNGGQWETSTGF